MANEYRYGAYGEIGETAARNAVQSGTVPVYVGTAPVNLIRGWESAGLVNEPVKLSSLTDAQARLGYSADWGAFTHCEATVAHFNNSIGNIGPIYAINVLDPAVHRKAERTQAQLIFTAGRAELAGSAIILDTLEIADGAYTEGTDYSVDYNFTKNITVITSLNSSSPLSGALSASFYEVDPAMVQSDDVIGGRLVIVERLLAHLLRDRLLG